jgi:pimeloyl-ACP methyl ester carboxylesterase
VSRTTAFLEAPTRVAVLRSLRGGPAPDSASARTPVCLLHGLGSRASDWRPQLDALEADRPWIAPDLRGHGDSPRAAAPVSVHDHARDVALSLDEWCPDRPMHLVGLSLGSMVALELARLRPKRCASLFLMSTTGDTRLNSGFARFLFRLRLHSLRWFGLRGTAHLVAWMLFPRTKQRSQRRAVIEQLVSNDPRSYRACLEGIPGWEVLSDASAIGAPTVVLRPERDFFPERVALELATALPGGRLERLGDVGHAAPIEDPDRVNPLLLEHLRTVEAAR